MMSPAVRRCKRKERPPDEMSSAEDGLIALIALYSAGEGDSRALEERSAIHGGSLMHLMHRGTEWYRVVPSRVQGKMPFERSDGLDPGRRSEASGLAGPGSADPGLVRSPLVCQGFTTSGNPELCYAPAMKFSIPQSQQPQPQPAA